ncbi:hypothetical protein AAFF_G00431540 [Aldrovandia affinis]|uniref:Reverse transcriptase domain-containing protein n=1 Tax=Aldrovandia affinis TaxID=143900 RepID=A0AAD7S9B1_9TELE|nr:hypothetical protein AAFF_G00431540 [Aldrovandia affinis]
MVRVLSADMSKAFNHVDHAKLLQHLADIKLCPRLLAWLHSYTTGRRQRVMTNGAYSVRGDIRRYADNVGLSRAIPLTNIESITTMGMEMEQLDNKMLMNGKMSVEVRICFYKNPPQPGAVSEESL